MNLNKKFNFKKENNFPFDSGEFKINSANLKIVIIASYAPSIINFRKELIAAFLQYAEVTVLAPWEDKETESAIVALGVAYRPIFLSSRGVNPQEDLKTMRELVNLLKEISPEFVYSYTIKPVIWGSIAAKKQV